jgi:hypothetical protein
MFRPCSAAIVVLPFLASAIFAGPQIEFDTKTFDCGTVIEGKTDKLNAVFVVKNTGDKLLKLEEVRPGCGCTVVKYDTLVQPGKTAKIEAQVNIAGYRSGPISKSVTVKSNAGNEPTVALTIKATVMAVIDVSESYLGLTASNEKVPHTLYFASKKADLKVSDVSFKPTGNTGGLAWQSPAIDHKWIPTDSVRADGCHVFKLEILSPGVENAVSGEFIIKTNHPEKPEVVLRGGIGK